NGFPVDRVGDSSPLEYVDEIVDPGAPSLCVPASGCACCRFLLDAFPYGGAHGGPRVGFLVLLPRRFMIVCGGVVVLDVLVLVVTLVRAVGDDRRGDAPDDGGSEVDPGGVRGEEAGELAGRDPAEGDEDGEGQEAERGPFEDVRQAAPRGRRGRGRGLLRRGLRRALAGLP